MSNKYKVKCLVSLVETIEIDTQGSSEALGGVINRAREIVMNRHNISIWDSKVSDISVANVEKTVIVFENDEVMVTFEDLIDNLAYLDSARAMEQSTSHNDCFPSTICSRRVEKTLRRDFQQED